MKQFGGSWTPLSGVPLDVTFEANILKTVWDTGDGGKKRLSRRRRRKNKVTKSVQGDFASERREVVSHIVCLPLPNPTP
jgi:hypothetical protein